MKDADQRRVHLSVHLRGERKLRRTVRFSGARPWILDAGKNQAGLERPHFVATETVAVAPVMPASKYDEYGKEHTCRSSTNRPRW